MKKIQIVLVALVLSMVLVLSAFSNVSCAGQTPAAKPSPPSTGQPTSPPAGPLKPIKIAWIESLTGMYSTLGIPAKRGVDAYVNWLNKQGGIDGHRIELTVYDNESDANKSILAFKKAVDLDKAHVVVGVSATGLSMALAPSVGETKTPFVSTTGSEVFENTNKKVGGEQQKWNFRPHAGNSIEKSVCIAGYMKKQNMSKMAWFSPETSFGKAGRDAALDVLPKTGIEVVLSDTYPGDATTFGPLISKLKEKPEIQLIFCYGSEMASALASVAIKEAGFGDKLIISNTITGAEQLKLERVMKAFDGCPGIATSVEVLNTLPDANLNKVALTKLNKIWGESYPGEKIRGTFDTIAVQGLIPVEETFRRLLKAQPDILDKDLAVIRSAFRDTLETIPTYSNGTNMISLSPNDHGGSIIGTTDLHAKFTSGGTWAYLGGDPCDPDYVRLIQELAPKAGWTGPVAQLAK